ncbi:MAG: phosphoserine phosphatase SerB [Hyphomicrobiaceae bacterium]
MSPTPAQVIVLTGPPGANAIDDAALAALREAFPASMAQEQWLSRGDAWQAPAPAGEPVVVRATAAAALARYPIDVNMVPAEALSRRKKLLVADMESTIIEQECLDELAGFAGVQEQISGITARAMRGELDFEAALNERVGLLKGLNADLLQHVYDRVTLMPGAETLVKTMRSHGATCALVSGGFTFFTQRIAARLGFDLHRANALDVADGKLAGTVALPILGREAKLQTLQELAKAGGLQPSETIAVGDGANDLAMIEAAGLGVAFRAKPILSQRAAASIIHGDLTALLYLQGYRRDEFAAAG